MFGWTPAHGATGVSRQTKVTVRFTEPVAGVSTKTFILRELKTRKVIPSGDVLRLAADGGHSRAKAPLAAKKAYYATISPAITDLAGNHLIGTLWRFTTRR